MSEPTSVPTSVDLSAKMSAGQAAVGTQAAAASPQRLAATMVAATLGLSLLFVSGFAAPSLVHNAAHDWRHAHNFPCH